MFDIVNDAVGPRYKAKLENRSYAEGASREGKALEELLTHTLRHSANISIRCVCFDKTVANAE